MHMRAAWLLLPLLLTAGLSGCLGVDNMADLKASLGYGPEPLQVLAPVARARASLTLASVDMPVAFSAQGSQDPQGLPLDFRWDFGDGSRSQGGEATHRYLAPGVFRVALQATNAAGRVGEDSLMLTVSENRAPLVGLQVLRGETHVQRARVGEELRFIAHASDPEGQPLALRWDFGDGATALTPDATHAYDAGGRFAVTLRAEDPSGLAASASQVLAIDQLLTERGRVDLLDDVGQHALPLGPGATQVVVGLDFPSSLGLNKLVVVVLDAQGREVGRKAGEPPLLAQGSFRVSLDLGSQALQTRTPGTWAVLVQLASGAQVDYGLTTEVRY